MTPTDVRLADYDIILINTSGGKDSQTMMRIVVKRAQEEGVLDRLVTVHADLGRVEWPGTAELAEEQAKRYGLPFIKVARTQNDLLDHVIANHERNVAKDDVKVPWPDSGNRWCTSDHKRGPVYTVMTALIEERGLKGRAPSRGRQGQRAARLLNCMGIRADESEARAKKVPFNYDKKASGKGVAKQVWTWYPIFDWTEDQVWADIQAHDVPHHPAYDNGMPRLSCCFCVLAGKGALTRAAQLAPELAEVYVALERRTGFTFKNGLSMSEVIEAAKRSAEPVVADNWAA